MKCYRFHSAQSLVSICMYQCLATLLLVVCQTQLTRHFTLEKLSYPRLDNSGTVKPRLVESQPQVEWL